MARTFRLVGLLGFLLATLFARTAHAEDDVDKRRAAAKKRVSAGLATFAAGYAVPALAGGAFYRRDDGSFPAAILIPVFGPWIAMGRENFAWKTTMTSRVARLGEGDCRSSSGRDGESSSGWCGVGSALFLGLPMLVVEFLTVGLAPLTQATGLILALSGADDFASAETASAREERRRTALKPKMKVTPTMMPAGVGVNLAITEW